MPKRVMGGRHQRLRAGPALAVFLAGLALLGVLAHSAGGERNQRGHLIVSVAGEITPHRLPRHRLAPVALHIGGTISTDDDSPLPRLRRIRLLITGRGVLTTAGLPVCARARLRNADSRLALERCRGALVGRGGLEATVFVPHQAPFGLHSDLLAFNGRDKRGPVLWVHAYSTNPPLAIVFPFVIHRHGSRLGTALTATVPPALGDLPHLSAFHLDLFRRFTYRGRPRSYLSASCPAATGFTGGFLTFARATYAFAGGRRLHIEAVRGCSTH